MAVERMQTCESVDKLAKQLGVTRRCRYNWRAELEAVEPSEAAARPSTHAAAQRKEFLQLKRLLAEKQRLWRESIYESCCLCRAD